MANTIEIIIRQSGQGNAISTTVKELGGLDKAASGSIGMIGKFGSALASMGTIAGGILVANVFSRLADGILSVARVGLDAVGSQQMLEASLKSLLTANLMYEEQTKSVTTAITKQLMSQDEYSQKLDELNAKLNTQRATYQEQQERIRQLTLQYGENGLNVLKLKAQHEQLAIAIRGTEQDISSLATSETKYATSTVTSIEKVMDQAEAFKIAKQQTADLLDFVSKLAVVSPFETEAVEQTTKYAIAVGMGVEATKEFVPAFLDLAASVGITSESLGFAADQLFQVKKIGKLTEIDLRQLRRMGIDLAKVIGVEMGMSVEEFNAQAEKSPEIFDELFSAITRFSQNTFAGTSQEMATSVKGLQSTISDVFVIGSRTFMRPLVEAVTPVMTEVIGKISDFVLGGDLATVGQQFADNLMGAFRAAFDIVTIGQTLGWDAAFIVAFQMLQNNIIPIVEPFIFGIAGVVANLIIAYWPTIQAALIQWRDQFFSWVAELYPQIPSLLGGLATAVGDFLVNQAPIIRDNVSAWANEFWSWVNTAIGQVGAVLGGLIAAIYAWAFSGEGSVQLNTIGQGIGQAIVDGVGFLFENVGQITVVLIKLAAGLAAGVAAIAGLLIAIGAQLVAGIIEGILESIGVDLEPAMFNELGAMLAGMGANLATIAKELGKRILIGINEGLKNINQTFDGIIKNAIAVWEDVDWMALGVSTVDGILEGLKENAHLVWEFFKEMAQKAWSEMASSIGFGSPATEFMPLGQSMIQGLVAGAQSEDFAAQFVDSLNMGSIARELGGGGSGWKEMRRIIGQAIQNNIGLLAEGNTQAMMDVIRSTAARFRFPPEVAASFAQLNGLLDIASQQYRSLMLQMQQEALNSAVQIAGSWSTLAMSFADMVQSQMGSMAEAQKVYQDTQKEIDKLTKEYSKQQDKLTDLQAELVAATDEYGAGSDRVIKLREEIEKLTREMGANQAAQAQLAQSTRQQWASVFTVSGPMSERQGTLTEQIAALQDFLASGAEAITHTVAGQEFVIFDRIKAQEELNRLLAEQARKEEEIRKAQEAQAQLKSLQDQISLIKAFRDIGQAIPEGIAFGLNASADDLLAATNALIAAMVQDIDSSLGVASPSKVMFNKFKDQIGGGMVRGLMAVKPMLEGAIQPMINPLVNASGTAGRVTNNYFNQTVNTRAESSTVIGDFRTMQLMAG